MREVRWWSGRGGLNGLDGRCTSEASHKFGPHILPEWSSSCDNRYRPPELPKSRWSRLRIVRIIRACLPSPAVNRES